MLSFRGDRLLALVNHALVASVRDHTFAAGDAVIGAGVYAGHAARVRAEFSDVSLLR